MDQDLLEAWSLGLAAGYVRSGDVGTPFPDGTDRAHLWSQGWRLGLQCGADRDRRLATPQEGATPVTASASP